jgi:hypothetical protein
MAIEFISLLLTKAALQIKCFSNSLTRNKFLSNLLFLKGMTGALAPFGYLVLKNLIEHVLYKRIFSNKLDLFWTRTLFSSICKLAKASATYLLDVYVKY